MTKLTDNYDAWKTRQPDEPLDIDDPYENLKHWYDKNQHLKGQYGELLELIPQVLKQMEFMEAEIDRLHYLSIYTMGV